MSHSNEAHIIAIMSPKPGKADRVRRVLTEQSQSVHAKEDYCLRFVVTEQTDAESPETPDFVLVETYLDRRSIDQHIAETHFKEMNKALAEEDGGLLAKKYVVFTKSVSGFELGRKFF